MRTVRAFHSRVYFTVEQAFASQVIASGMTWQPVTLQAMTCEGRAQSTQLEVHPTLGVQSS
ncbi:MAG TPA: hypothetical protein DCL15_05530 [Chloroflexi bacterium]|nr:hypothetical protein [Chloroflexota bacterium]HHW85079.1 hypothetical protein [Chloroflexota bacterium]